MDVLEKGLSASNFAMLGLGDIVIPGNNQPQYHFSFKSMTFLQYLFINFLQSDWLIFIINIQKTDKCCYLVGHFDG